MLDWKNLLKPTTDRLGGSIATDGPTVPGGPRTLAGGGLMWSFVVVLWLIGVGFFEYDARINTQIIYNTLTLFLSRLDVN